MTTQRIVAVLLGVLLAAPAYGQLENDAWTSKTVLRAPDGWYAAPAHATLLPDGRILMIGYERDTEDPLLATDQRRSAFLFDPAPAGSPPPSEVVIDARVQPIDADGLFVQPQYVVVDDLFCTGNALTADGQLFTAGGTRLIFDTIGGQTYVVGLQYATLFDSADWVRLPADMVSVATFGSPARWYPAVTRLPDERMLVTGGYDIVAPTPTANVSAEVWDPATGGWTELSAVGETPNEIFNGDYTHPFVLPEELTGFDLLMFGEAGRPVFLELDDPVVWSVSSAVRTDTQPGQVPNNGASSVLLPIRPGAPSGSGSVLMAGGQAGTSHQRSLDVYDPTTDAWLPRVDLVVPRHHPSTVLLPDGRVLVVAGHNTTGDIQLQQAGYVDPKGGFQLTFGNAVMGEVRGYHTISLLLPDGRVLVGGGRDLVTATSGEKSDLRYLSPAYLTQPRPILTRAPSELTFGQTFTVRSKGPQPTSAMLIGLGSMTHSMDFNQRAVELELVPHAPGGWVGGAAPIAAQHVTRFRAPTNATIAPAGHYMLFLLDAAGVPSVAPIVKLD